MSRWSKDLGKVLAAQRLHFRVIFSVENMENEMVIVSKEKSKLAIEPPAGISKKGFKMCYYCISLGIFSLWRKMWTVGRVIHMFTDSSTETIGLGFFNNMHMRNNGFQGSRSGDNQGLCNSDLRKGDTNVMLSTTWPNIWIKTDGILIVEVQRTWLVRTSLSLMTSLLRRDIWNLEIMGKPNWSVLVSWMFRESLRLRNFLLSKASMLI